MVHKKYIRRGGRLYGPYFYESYRDGDKVKKRYITEEEYNALHKPNFFENLSRVKPAVYTTLVLLVIVAAAIFLINHTQPTGKVSLSMETQYAEGAPLSGLVRFNLRQGELIPADSKVVVQFGSEEKEFLISELFDSASVSSGNFFAEGASISGSGSGYGLIGSRVMYPTVDFELKISNVDSGSSETPAESEPETPVEEVPVEEPPIEETPVSEETPAEDILTEEVPASEETSSEELSDNAETAESSAEGDSAEPSSPITGGVISEGEFIVSGSASNGADFVYALEDGQDASIVSGSVKVDGGEIGDENVELSVSGNDAAVSTDYSISEEGFGEDYLGSESLVLSIDISKFGLTAQTGELSVQLVYGGEVLASASEMIFVSGDDSETPAEETEDEEDSSSGGGGAVLNETVTNETAGNETVSFNETAGNESLGNETIVLNETLSNETIIINETIEVNETLVLNETTVRIETSRGAIRLGQPVKWTKNVSLDEPANVTIEIPFGAESISVKKVDEIGEEVEVEAALVTGKVTASIELEKEPAFVSWLKKLFSRITGRVVEEQNETAPEETLEVVLDENATNYIVEYYTDAPTSAEIETSYGKRVVISGPEELNYTDILSFANVAEKVSVDNSAGIVVYWVENASAVPFEAYDSDGDGLVDYIEWITPHLSNQTFDIILISKAEHLDAERNFVEDVYELVKDRDYNYSEIPAGHYLRVVFEKALVSGRDITLYARSGSNASVQAYENNGTELIADFGEISDDGEYKVYLENLSGAQDTFDLLVLGEENTSIEFDYVVDPVITALSLALNATQSLLLNVSAASADSGLPVINVTDWRINENSMAVVNLPFESNVSDRTYGAVRSYSSYNGTYNVTLDGSGATQPRLHLNGVSGSCYYFDATNWINITNLSLGNVYTIEMWVYPTTTGNGDIIGNVYTSTNTFGAAYVSANSYLYWYYGGQVVSSSPYIAYQSRWVHVALVYDGYKGRIYINGTLAATGNKYPNVAMNNPLRIGYSFTSPTSRWTGFIDEVKIYDRALSSAQIAQDYNDGSAGKTQEIVARDEIKEGEVWSVAVTPNNKSGTYADGPTEFTNNVTIPAILLSRINNSVIGLNASQTLILTDMANVSVSDGRAIQNITDWRVNGNSMAYVNLPFDSYVINGSTGAVRSYSTYAPQYNVTLDGNTNYLPQRTTGCKVGNCYYFDGQSWINITNLSLGNVYTIEMWIYPTVAGSKEVIGNVYSSTSSFGSVYASANSYLTWYYGGQAISSSPAVVYQSRWTHVALVYDGYKGKVYINGTLAAVGNKYANIIMNNPLRIGYAYTPATTPWSGYIDDVKIYGRALSSAQIAQDYNAGFLDNRSAYKITRQELKTEENWSVAVTPNSGQEAYPDGATILSDNVTVSFITLPNATEVVLTSTNPGYEDTTVNLSYSITSVIEPDGLPVQNITDWRRNGNSIAYVNLPFDSYVINGSTGAIRSYSTYASQYNVTLDGNTNYLPQRVSSCQVGGCYYYDGSSWMNITNVSVGKNFTIEFWVYPGYASLRDTVGGDYASSASFGEIGVGGNNAVYYVYNGGSTVNTGTVTTIQNRWSYVALTYNGSIAKIYVNGTLAATSPAHTMSLNNPLRIGYTYRSYWGALIQGYIDEFKIYDRTLSAEQIVTNYLHGLGKTSSNEINNTELRLGDSWSVAVTPNNGQDAYSDGYTTISNVISLTATPNMPSPQINSTDGNDYGDSALHCFAVVSESTNSLLNASVRWYKDSVLSYSADYNNSYASGSTVDAVLGAGNLTEGDIWKCSMRVSNGVKWSAWGNSSNLTVKGTPPQIDFVSPTPDNGGTVYGNTASINASLNKDVSSCTLYVSSGLANPLGDGSDGTLSVSAANIVVNNYTYLTGNESAGDSVLAVGSGLAFSAGDEVMIIQMQHNSSAGVYEFGAVASADANSITLVSGLGRTYYSGKFNQTGAQATQVIRVPQYLNVSVAAGASITSSAWSGYSGGIVVFRALGLVNVSGGINVSYKGFRGGVAAQAIYASGQQGESVTGLGVGPETSSTDDITTIFLSNVGGGGGGGVNAGVNGGDTVGGGGGGGGYGTNGTQCTYTGFNAHCGDNGTVYGYANLSVIPLGSGGGGGGSDNSGLNAAGGGSAGGAIIISAGSINVSGLITSTGQNGFACGGTEDGSGGAGSGGTILLSASDLALGAGKVNASGGIGPNSCYGAGNKGGDGGKGRIALNFTTYSGSLDPVSGYNGSFDLSLENIQSYAMTVFNAGANSAANYTLKDLTFGNSYEFYAGCTGAYGASNTSASRTFTTLESLPLLRNVSCGETVTSSVTLDSDINCGKLYNNESVIIGADNVNFNCNGHTLNFSTQSTYPNGSCINFAFSIGFSVPSRNNITIRNCIINASDGVSHNGIVLSDSNNSVIVNNTFNINSTYLGCAGFSGLAVALQQSHAAVVENNTLNLMGGDYGIKLTLASSNNNVSRNSIYGGTYSTYVSGYSPLLAENNTFSYNYLEGFRAPLGTSNYVFLDGANNTKFVSTRMVRKPSVGWIWTAGNISALNFTNTTFEVDNSTLWYPDSFVINNSFVDYLGLVLMNEQKLNISYNLVFANSSELSFLNKSAQITLKNLPYTNPAIVVKDEGRSWAYCNSPRCVNTSYSGGTFVFNVTGFTSYKAAESGSLFDCGVLNESSVMSGDLDSSGTCFYMNASNVVLDCRGYSVSYGTGGGNYSFGVNATNVQNITIKNCTFVKGSSSGANGYGVLLYNVTSSTVSDSSVTTNGTLYNHGIVIKGSQNNLVENNSVATSGQEANYGVYLAPRAGGSSANTLVKYSVAAKTIYSSACIPQQGVNSCAVCADGVNCPTVLGQRSGCRVSFKAFNGGKMLNFTVSGSVDNGTIEVLGGEDFYCELNGNRIFYTYSKDNCGGKKYANVPGAYFSVGENILECYASGSGASRYQGIRLLAFSYSSPDGLSTGNTVRNNSIRSYGVSALGIGTQSHGLAVEDSSNTNIFKNNSITALGASSDAVYVLGSSGNEFIGNNLNSSRSAVRLVRALSTKFTGSIIAGNSTLYIEEPYGDIDYSQPITFGAQTDISNVVAISPNSTRVDSADSLGSQLNKSAMITIKELPFYGMSALVDIADSGSFQDCSAQRCNYVNYSAGTGVYSFNASSFTTYAVKEAEICRELDENGTYVLKGSLLAAGDCFSITEGNVTLDCNGYQIVGNGSGIGIFVNNTINTTIQNCYISNFTEAVDFLAGNLSTVRNVTTYRVKLGIGFNGTDDSSVRNSNITANASGVKFGINLYGGAGNNTIDGNIISDGIYLNSSSHGTRITNNNITSIITSAVAIYLSNNNSVENNVMNVYGNYSSTVNYLPGRGAVYLYSSDRNNISNNYMRVESDYASGFNQLYHSSAVAFSSSDGNQFYNNTIVTNGTSRAVGVEVLYGSAYNVFDRNNITTYTSGSDGYGIWFWRGVTDYGPFGGPGNNITNNDITTKNMTNSGANNGIMFQGGGGGLLPYHTNYTLISGNRIRTQTYDPVNYPASPIYVSVSASYPQCPDWTIKDNYFYGESGAYGGSAGILLDMASCGIRQQIVNNTFLMGRGGLRDPGLYANVTLNNFTVMPGATVVGPAITLQSTNGVNGTIEYNSIYFRNPAIYDDYPISVATSGTRIKHNNITASGYGPLLNAGDILFENNSVLYNIDTTGYGITMQSYSNINITGNKIIAGGCAGSGIMLRYAAANQNYTMEYNNITVLCGSGVSGISATGGTFGGHYQKVRIIGNNIYVNGSYQTSGISAIDGIANSTIAYNNITVYATGTQNTGIVLGGYSDNFDASGNNISRNNILVSQRGGEITAGASYGIGGTSWAARMPRGIVEYNNITVVFNKSYGFKAYFGNGSFVGNSIYSYAPNWTNFMGGYSINSTFANNTYLRGNTALWFQGAFNISSDDLSAPRFNISQNRATLNSTALPEFNKSAQITFGGLNFGIAYAVVDDNDDGVFDVCNGTRCVNLSYLNGVFKFNVSGFTTYKAMGNLNVTISGPANGTITDEPYVNFTINASSGAGLANATLNVYNQTGGLYNRTTVDLGSVVETTVGVVVTLVDGIYNWFWEVFDLATAFVNTGEQEGYNRTIIAQIPAGPHLYFVSPTLPNASSSPGSMVAVNITTVSVAGLREFKYNWNGTNYTMYNNSLVLMLNFDNRSGLGESGTAVMDASVYGNNGTCSGSTCPVLAGGVYGRAYSFDGSNDYFSFGSSVIPAGAYTLSLWLNISSTQAASLSGIITDCDAWNSPYNGKYAAVAGASKTIYFGAYDVPGNYYGIAYNYSNYTNSWHMYTASWDGATSADAFKFYIDGVLVSTATMSATSYAGSRNLAIGSWPITTSQAYNGMIDEVRVWNYSRSADDIYEMYASGLTRYNMTDWSFYAAQRKNATDGLDYANYTYGACAKDRVSQANCTSRTITLAEVSSCGTLNSSTTLVSDVLSSGTCFTITTSNVTLDCAGYTITYGIDGLDNSYGVDANSVTNATIRDCTIIKTSNAGDFGIGVRLFNVTDSTIVNNNIQTNGEFDNYGVYVAVGSGNNISANTIRANGSVSYNQGIAVVSSGSNSLSGNNVSTNGLSKNYGVFFGAVNNTIEIVDYVTSPSASVCNNDSIANVPICKNHFDNPNVPGVVIGQTGCVDGEGWKTETLLNFTLDNDVDGGYIELIGGENVICTLNGNTVINFGVRNLCGYWTSADIPGNYFVVGSNDLTCSVAGSGEEEDNGLTLSKFYISPYSPPVVGTGAGASSNVVTGNAILSAGSANESHGIRIEDTSNDNIFNENEINATGLLADSISIFKSYANSFANNSLDYSRTGVRLGKSLANLFDDSYMPGTSPLYIEETYGDIEYTVPINITQQMNLSVPVTIALNASRVNSSFAGADAINKSAKILLRNLPFWRVTTLVDEGDLDNFVPCTSPRCIEDSYSFGNFKFNVSSFTTYSAQEETVCEVLDVPQTFVFLNDVHANGDCFRIIGQNVTLDCNGFALIGNGQGIGVLVNNTYNATIKDCYIANFTDGVNFRSASASRILNTTFAKDVRSINFSASTANFVEDIRIRNVTNWTHGVGIYLSGASSTNIFNRVDLLVNSTMTVSGLGGIGMIVSSGGNNGVHNSSFINMSQGGIWIKDSSVYNYLNNVTLGKTPTGGGNTPWGINFAADNNSANNIFVGVNGAGNLLAPAIYIGASNIEVSNVTLWNVYEAVTTGASPAWLRLHDFNISCSYSGRDCVGRITGTFPPGAGFVSSLIYDGIMTGPAGAGADGINLYNNNSVHNVSFGGTFSNDALLVYGQNSSVYNCTFTSISSGTPLRIAGDAWTTVEGNRIYNNNIINSGSSTSDIILLAAYARDNVIENNNLENMTVGYYNYGVIYADTDSNTWNNTIRNNVITNVSGGVAIKVSANETYVINNTINKVNSGIAVQPYKNGAGIAIEDSDGNSLIANNTITNVKTAAIVQQSLTSGRNARDIVRDNTIKNASIGLHVGGANAVADPYLSVWFNNYIENVSTALRVFSAYNVTMYNNTVVNSRSGINISSSDSSYGGGCSSRFATIENNTFINVTFAATAEGWYWGSPSCDSTDRMARYNSIKGNRFVNSSAGLKIYGLAESQISDNVFEGRFAQYGALFYLGGNNTAGNNTFANVTMWGLYLSNSTNNTLLNNYVYGDNASIEGIFLEVAANNNLLANNIINLTGANSKAIEVSSSKGNAFQNNSLLGFKLYAVNLIKSINNTFSDSYLPLGSGIGSMFVNESNGTILFTQAINMSDYTNLSSLIAISFNRTFVNSSDSAGNQINKSAQITMSGIDAATPRIFVDLNDSGYYAECADGKCAESSYNRPAKIFVFNVSSFTSYAILDLPYNPGISFVSPTPADMTRTNNVNASAGVNVSVTNATTMNRFIWNWNGTDYTMYNSSLIVMYNFDNRSLLGENHTWVVDMSQYGNNARCSSTGCATFNATGRYNGGYEFDGGSDYWQMKTSAITGYNPTTTIAAWVRPTSAGLTNNGVIYSEDINVGTVYLLRLNTTGHPEYMIWRNSVWSIATSNVSLQAGKWHYIVATLGADGTKTYVDGILRGYSANTLPVAGGTIVNSWIGRHTGGGYWSGAIDEFRIWNRTLSAAEVAQAYVSNLNKYDTDKWIFYANESNLTANYNFTYQASAFVTESVGNSTEQRQFMIDTIGPNVSINWPPNATLTNETVINFTVNLSDAGGLANATLSIYNLTGLFDRITVELGGVVQTTLGIVVTLADGTYNWFWEVFDLATNVFNTATQGEGNRTLSVDGTQPAISFISPTPNDNSRVREDSLAISVSASDEHLANITIYLYNATDLVNSSFSESSPNEVVFTNLVNETSYYVNATAYDTYGNFNSTETRTFNVLFFVGGISGCINITDYGNYNLTEDASSNTTCIYINASNVSLDCLGRTILYNVQGSDNSYGISIYSASNVTIKNCIIQDINASGASGFAIRPVGMSSSLIQNNSMYTWGTSTNKGMYVSTSVGNVITGNLISTNGSGANNYGIDWIGIDETTEGNVFTNNNITTNGTSGNYGIVIRQASMLAADDNIIDGNTISTSGSASSNAGIYLLYTSRNNITNNNITTNGLDGSTGIVLLNLVTNSLVYKNNIRTNGQGSANYGLYLSSSFNGNNVSDNTIATNGTINNMGIYMNGAGENDNAFVNNAISTSGSGSYGIRFAGTNNYFANTLLNNSAQWILAQSAAGTINFTNTTFRALNGSVNFAGLFQMAASQQVNRTNLDITYNRTFLNSTEISFLNKSAGISLYGINLTNAEVFVDINDSGNFASCGAPRCSLLSYNRTTGIFRFNVSSFTTYAAGYVNLAPLINFISQVPADISTINAIANGLNISYNITDETPAINASSVKIYYKSNSSASDIMYYVNGTAVSGFQSYSGTNVSLNWTFGLDDNEIYPARYNFDEEYVEDTAHLNTTLSSNNEYLRIRFFNISNTKGYNIFEFMANATPASGSLRIYYCNSSYTSGNILVSADCTNFYTLLATTPYNHSHSAFSGHMIAPLAINTTSGTVGSVYVTATSYLVLRGRTGSIWNAYYINNISRPDSVQTTSTGGNFWSNFAGTIDAHIHQYDETDALWYYVCANDTEGLGNCSSVRQDLINLTGLPPSAPYVYNPTEGIYSGDITINYTAALSPNGYNITFYNISLMYANESYAKTIISNNSLNLSYVFNITGTVDGQYLISVVACDTYNQCSRGYSANFTIVSNRAPTIALVSPANGNTTTDRTPTFTWTGSDPDNDSLTYEFNLSLVAMSTCTEADRFESPSTNTTTLSTDLQCFSDDGDYYVWSVRAYDGTNYSDWASYRTLNIATLVSISLPVNSINFGSLGFLKSNETTSGTPAPFTIQNDGNVLINITSGATNLWTTIGNPNKYYKFKARESGETGSFNTGLSTTIFTNVTATASPAMCIAEMAYPDSADSGYVDIYVEVPTDEGSGARSSTMTFIASLAE